tara:strand:- start:650 stop:1261 length:612 start_codon:yes stop_codon:yes gene_type:complete
MPYLGTQPNNVKKNIGLYNPNKILQLTKEGSWGGSLELIESQTVSSAVAQVDFTSIQESKYDVHFLQLNNFETVSGTNILTLRFSNDSGSSFESSNYQYAMQRFGTTFTERRSTSASEMSYLATKDSTNVYQVYIYLYNLGNSSKYSFITNQSPVGVDGSNIFGYFGGGVYAVAETINALRIFNSTGANFTQGTAKIFGVKQI